MTTRATVVLAAALLMVLSLVACQESLQPKTEDLIGTWVHDERGGPTASIRILPDSRITIEKLPAGLLEPVGGFSTSVDWTELVDAEGTWDLAGDSSGGYFLRLNLDGNLGSGSRGIRLDGSGDSTSLYLLAGPTDYDVRVSFVRQADLATSSR